MNNFDNHKRASILVFADKVYHQIYKTISLTGEKIKVHTQDEALKIIRDSKPDVIIIDCGFNINKGIKLLIKIKAGHPEVPIILLTDKSSEEMAIKAFRAGARDYIQKPINISALQRSLKTLLQIKRSSREKRKQFVQPKTITPKTNDSLLSNEKPLSILRAVRYMEENLTHTITLDDCANKARLSKYHFCRTFKKYMGMSPMKYVSSMRFNQAKELLKARNLSMLEIALSVGYGDYSSFVREFKRHTGTMPRKYRESIKKNRLPS